MNRTYSVQVQELTEWDPRAEPPTGARIQLKPHQLTLLHACRHYEAGAIYFQRQSRHRLAAGAEGPDDDYMHTRIGIIGDKVGAGKSYVLLALALGEGGSGAVAGSSGEGTRESTAAITTIQRYKVETLCQNRIVVHAREQTTVYPTSVLVIPHNLCNQWKGYIESYTDTARVLYVYNKKAIDPLLRDPRTIEGYPLVVVSTTYYNPLATALDDAHIRLRRVIFDEIDTMPFTSAREMVADFHWFVTASYGNLLYPRGSRTWDPYTLQYSFHAAGLRHTGFVKRLFLDLCTSMDRPLLHMLVLRNANDYVDGQFQLPPQIVETVRCTEPRAIRVLSGLVDRHIIECLNAGDVTSAIERIDPRRRYKEANVVEMILSKYQDDLHNVDVQIEAATQAVYANAADKEQRLARLREKRAGLEARMASIQDRVQGTLMCPICYEDIANKVVLHCCMNSFCFTCIHMWIHSRESCPLCKKALTRDDVLVVDENAVAPAPTHEPAAVAEPAPDPAAMDPRHDKLRNMMAVLQDRRGARVSFKCLIFSNYDNTFVRVAQELTQAGIRFGYLKGNTVQIQSRVNEYRQGQLDVLLVNGTSYGSGLNLENTTDVIMMHKCNPETEKQILGRAQRPGRTEALRVWYMLYENEMRAGAASV